MKVPKTAKITGRSSSITNAFIQAILPTKAWSDQEESTALGILGMERPILSCAYCGSETSEWDHLFPLVRNKRPTGFIHEIRNLVPACGRCNHSKSGANWDSWFQSSTSNSPTKRRIEDREKRFRRLEAFVEWGNLRPLEFDDLAGNVETLDEYWATLVKLQADMALAQKLADRLKPLLQAGLNSRKSH